MKKILAMGLACAVVLTPMVSVHAEEVHEVCHISGCNLGECFMDTDCDGICDHFVDADEDGICDHCHDHGKPVQSGAAVGKTTNTTNSTSTYSNSHHGSHHSSKSSGHHKGHH